MQRFAINASFKSNWNFGLKAIEIFTRSILNGKIRQATQFITEQMESGVRMPNEDAIKPAGIEN